MRPLSANSQPTSPPFGALPTRATRRIVSVEPALYGAHSALPPKASLLGVRRGVVMDLHTLDAVRRHGVNRGGRRSHAPVGVIDAGKECDFGPSSQAEPDLVVRIER